MDGGKKVEAPDDRLDDRATEDAFEPRRWRLTQPPLLPGRVGDVTVSNTMKSPAPRSDAGRAK